MCPWGSTELLRASSQSDVVDLCCTQRQILRVVRDTLFLIYLMIQLLEEFYVNTCCVSCLWVLGDPLRQLAECSWGIELAGTLMYAKSWVWCKEVSKIGFQAPRSRVCEILAGKVSLLSEVNICPVENLNTTRTEALGVLRSILARWNPFAACCCVCMWMADWEQTPQIQNTLDS